MFRSYTDGEAARRGRARNKNVGLIEATTGEGLVSGLMCFHTTFTCSEAYIRRAFDLDDDAAHRFTEVARPMVETGHGGHSWRSGGIRSV